MEKNNKISVLNKMTGLSPKYIAQECKVPQNSCSNLRHKHGFSEAINPGMTENSCDFDSRGTKCLHCENMAKNFLYLESLLRNNKEKQCNLCNSAYKYLQYVNRNIMQVFGNFDSIVEAAKAFQSNAPMPVLPSGSSSTGKVLGEGIGGGGGAGGVGAMKQQVTRAVAGAAAAAAASSHTQPTGVKSNKSLRSKIKSQKSTKSLKSATHHKKSKSRTKITIKINKGSGAVKLNALAKGKAKATKSKSKLKHTNSVVHSASQYKNLRSKSRKSKNKSKSKSKYEIPWMLLKQNLPQKKETPAIRAMKSKVKA